MNVLEERKEYIIDYPEVVNLVEEQMGVYWTPFEISVNKDVHDIMVNMTPEERHGTITTLKLFTLYEIEVHNYWDKVFEIFKHPADIQRMARCFSFFEMCVHAPFYSEINRALGVANEEFFNSYLKDPVLVERIEYLEKGMEEEIPIALAHLSVAEGVILYSSFAFLKHFQSQGKNKLLNVVRGINFSARDENLHSIGAAWLFNKVIEDGYKVKNLENRVYKAFKVAYEHECAIIDKIFEKGEIEGITQLQMKNFVQSRCDSVLKSLGFEPIFKPTYNPISKWFYSGINNFQYNDFFTGQGREYSRNWEESNFVWD